MIRRHHLHSPWRRALWSLGLIATMMLVGAIGLHLLEGAPYFEAFYMMSMIATSQGLTEAPATPGGKVFVSFMAFMAVGFITAALGFLFGPLFGKLWRIGVHKVEEEIRHLEHRPRR